MRKLTTISLVATIAVGCANHQLDPSRLAVTEAPLIAAISDISRIDMPAGTMLTAGITDGKPAYCSTTQIYFVNTSSYPVCFLDNGNNGNFDQIALPVLLGRNTFPLHHGLPYTPVDRVEAQRRTREIQEAETVAARKRLEDPAFVAQIEERNRQIARLQATEREARAYCSMQAQMASSMTPGLISALGAGIGVGNACMQYYQTTGRSPGAGMGY